MTDDALPGDVEENRQSDGAHRIDVVRGRIRATAASGAKHAEVRPPHIVWLWTCGGSSFGYRIHNELWSCSGRHCGRFRDSIVYGADGRYIGELLSGDRLIVRQASRDLRAPGFTPSLGWVGTPGRAAKPKIALPAGCEEFSLGWGRPGTAHGAARPARSSD